jgi:hypothetical protein
MYNNKSCEEFQYFVTCVLMLPAFKCHLDLSVLNVLGSMNMRLNFACDFL